jgi:hypothetical protein
MPKNDKRLLSDLAAWFGGALDVGDHRHGVLSTEDLDVEVTVRVRRRVSSDDARRYRDDVLAHLRQRPGLVRHCGCQVIARSQWLGKKQRDCAGSVVAAIVYRPGSRMTPATSSFVSAAGDLAFLFVCSAHRTNHGIDASHVLATIELPPSSLVEIRQLDKVRQEQRDAEYWAEQQQREADRRREEAAEAAAAAPPSGRRVGHLVDVDVDAKPGKGG